MDESAQGATGGAFLYSRKKKAKSSSGDYLETDSSDDTNSEELTDSDEDNNGFRPIDVPKIDVQGTGKSKVRRRPNVKKVEARRCKSESDKHTLTVDSKVSGISREGSASKFKPDESWIKLHQSDEEENPTSEPMDTGQEQENTTEGTLGVRQEEDEGLWMGEIKSESEVSEKQGDSQKSVVGNVSETKVNVADGDLSKAFRSKDKTSAIADKGQETIDDKNIACSRVDECMKETSAKGSIPVTSGLVQKQKQGYEGKLKSASGHTKSASLGATDLQILYQSDNVRKDSETASLSSVDQEMKTDISSNADLKTGDVEIRTESAMEVDKPDDAKSDISEESTQKPKMRSRLSVYDLEEIDLPEDFVKRTKQQIEDR